MHIWSNITEDMKYHFCTPELGNDLCFIRYPQCVSIAPLDFLPVMGSSQDTFSTSVSFIYFFILTSFLAYVALNIVLAIIIFSFQNENERGHGNKIFTILKKEREILTNALKTNNHEQYKAVEQGYDIDIEIKASHDNDNDRDLKIANKQDNKLEANDIQTQDDGDTQPNIGAVDSPTTIRTEVPSDVVAAARRHSNQYLKHSTTVEDFHVEDATDEASIEQLQRTLAMSSPTLVGDLIE